MPTFICGEAELVDLSTGNVIKRLPTPRCNHCARVCHPALHAKPGDNFGHCTRCDSDICAGCATKMERGGMCDVWEEKNKRLEAALERQLALSAYGI